MNPVNSETLIGKLEKEVDRHLIQAIKVYQNLSQDELNNQPSSGGWSIAQCLEHLNSYGDYYFPKMGILSGSSLRITNAI